MIIPSEQVKLLGLSNKELRVWDALRQGQSTPLAISSYTKVRRPTVYQILPRLHKRGLITSNIYNGKKRWSQAKDRDLDHELYKTKKVILNFEEGTEEVKGLSDATVVVHRGGKSVKKVLDGIIKEHKGERLYAIQGDRVAKGWERIYSARGMNKWNHTVKKGGIITEMIFPRGVVERQATLYGEEWARNFEGRATITHEIDESYFQHGGQIFIFRNSLYLMAMNEELIIEVHNSDIQKLLLSMFEYIQDNAQKFDINARLRDFFTQKPS